ncbi:MAG TPA: ATP-grasp domain-containing protein, partial [Pirellulales bacterium]|nr:ATP-grasp domain-containing protein [Pirellulales bacterium]
MNVFVYEHLTGGGLLPGHDAAWRSLAAEGRAMVQALAADFAALDGARVTCLRDARAETWQSAGCRMIDVTSAEEHRQQFDVCAASADWSLIIAPEIHGILLNRCRRVVDVGGRLLGPAPQLVALASDKQHTIEHLQAAGVPTPEGFSLDSGGAWPRDFSYPAVWKPRDGAGSHDILVIGAASDAPHQPAGVAGRLERFCGGVPVSVALLAGPRGCTALPACRQLLSQDGRLRYLGGSVPLPAPLAGRAAPLARRTAAALGDARGYFGI